MVTEECPRHRCGKCNICLASRTSIAPPHDLDGLFPGQEVLRIHINLIEKFPYVILMRCERQAPEPYLRHYGPLTQCCWPRRECLKRCEAFKRQRGKRRETEWRAESRILVR